MHQYGYISLNDASESSDDTTDDNVQLTIYDGQTLVGDSISIEFNPGSLNLNPNISYGKSFDLL